MLIIGQDKAQINKLKEELVESFDMNYEGSWPSQANLRVRDHT